MFRLLLCTAFLFAVFVDISKASPKDENGLSVKRVNDQTPCFLRVDPNCAAEDNFKKLNKNRWLRANLYPRKPLAFYSCWLSRKNVKRVKKKDQIRVMIKNKANVFDENGEKVFSPFSCGEAFTNKSFGIGCYEARLQPSMVFGLRMEMTLWGRDLSNGIRNNIYNAAGIRFYRLGTNLRMWTTAYTDTTDPLNLAYIPSIRPEKKMYSYGIKWTKKQLIYYVDGEIIRVLNTASVPDFVGPLRVGFAIYTLKNQTIIPDYEFEKPSEMRIDNFKFTPGESCKIQ